MPEKFKIVPWKRNLFRVPDKVQGWLAANPTAQIVVGCVKTVSRAHLEKGVYAHLGIGVAAGKLIYPQARVPMAEMGRYSRKNRDGWEVKRDDLPKITVTRSFDSPNWGDPSNGWHTVEWKQEVYQRDFYDPPNFSVRIEAIKQASEAVALRFVVDWPVNRADVEFDQNFLFALNLLQENVGLCDVLRADASTTDLLASLEMSWEFFPPGTAPEVERFFRAGMKLATAETESVVKDRADLFWHLNPQKYLRGTGGMNSYVGAMFADDLVVFENIRYGNALYVLFEDWAVTSRRSRIDLLKVRDGKYERIVHIDGWKKRLQKLIRQEKKKRGIEGKPMNKRGAA